LQFSGHIKGYSRRKRLRRRIDHVRIGSLGFADGRRRGARLGRIRIGWGQLGVGTDGFHYVILYCAALG